MEDSSVNDLMKRLSKLKEEGYLTDDEFEKEVKKINHKRNNTEKSTPLNSLSAFANNTYSKFQISREQKKKERDRIELEEQERIKNILAGNIAPINSSKYNLPTDEKLYFTVGANRKATLRSIKEYTENSTKRKGTLGRAVVGGVLLGPLGAVAGAATAKTEGKTEVKQKVKSSVETIDRGELLFTNKRIMFVGEKQIISLPYAELITVEFPRTDRLLLRYEAMEDQEYYQLSSSETKIFYEGIINNLVIK
jgi:hypothetical protein